MYPDKAEAFILKWCELAPTVLSKMGRSKDKEIKRLLDIMRQEANVSNLGERLIFICI